MVGTVPYIAITIVILVPEDRFELGSRNRAGFVKRFYYGFKAEIDENLTEVE